MYNFIKNKCETYLSIRQNRIIPMIKVEFEYMKEFVELSEGYYNESGEVILTDMGIWVDIDHVIEYLGYEMKDFSDLFKEWDSYASGEHGEVEFI